MSLPLIGYLGPVSNYGEGRGTKRYGSGGGGQVRVYPYKKGGGGKSFRPIEAAGGTKSIDVVLTWALKVLAVQTVRGLNKFPH